MAHFYYIYFYTTQGYFRLMNFFPEKGCFGIKKFPSFIFHNLDNLK